MIRERDTRFKFHLKCSSHFYAYKLMPFFKTLFKHYPLEASPNSPSPQTKVISPSSSEGPEFYHSSLPMALLDYKFLIDKIGLCPSR